MKRPVKVLSWIVLPPAALIIVLALALNLGLTPILRRVILPRAQQSLGLAITVDDAQAALFGGSAKLTAIRVANPPGYEEPFLFEAAEAKLDIGLPALLRRTIHLQEASVDRAVLRVVRNDDGKFNLLAIEPAQRKTDKQSGTPAASTKPLRLLIDALRAQATIEYVDAKGNGEPTRTGWTATITASNVATVARARSEWGQVSLRGHLAGNPNAFVTDIQGRVGPLVDSNTAGFDIAGHILAIDFDEIRSLADDLQIDGESIDLSLRLAAVDGTFTRQSQLALHVRQPRLTGSLARKAKHLPLPDELSVEIDIRGPVDHPECDWVGGLIRSLGGNLGGSLDTLIKGLNQGDNNVSKEVNDFVKKLEDIF